MNSHIGIVAIGRNEGERLPQLLESILGRVGKIVYVDSGSTDGTGLRPRWGSTSSTRHEPAVHRRPCPERRFRARCRRVYVQFLGGDAKWSPIGSTLRSSDSKRLTGRRLRPPPERHPDTSVYNRLCDIEWDLPIGEAAACGGVALIRVAAGRARSAASTRRLAPRAGVVPAVAASRMGDPPPRGRHGLARRSDDALRPVVDAQRPHWLRLCAGRRHAR